ncbi:MAG: sarcosine oxidase subunit gamma, partial [Alphaproteobacteria bacterium]|nr:sarcosine oxidase subunit gamma [Alphaproteobacteria bacterium]
AGPRAGWALASGCPLDLEALPDGACTRTVFDRVEIIMIKYTSEHYRLEIGRSFAPFVWDFLVAVAREPS